MIFIRKSSWAIIVALVLVVGCTSSRDGAVRRPAQSAVAPSPAGADASATPYAAGPPYLTVRTGLRILVSGSDGLELFNLDGGARRLLIPSSNVNGDSWGLERVRGGVIAFGFFGGSGAGTMEAPAWFIPEGATPVARRLGSATGVLDEPSGGVWLIDFPKNNAGLGGGTVRLVDTSGRTLRKGAVTCCRRPEASAGNGRFVTTTVSEAGTRALHLYDAFSRRVIHDLTPAADDARFVAVEAGQVVWSDGDCAKRCPRHVVDLVTGRQREEAPFDGVTSPDGRHVAVAREGDPLTVDARVIANGEHGSSWLEWSSDGEWLLFARPDGRHLGIWRAGAPQAETIARDFRFVHGWSIFAAA